MSAYVEPLGAAVQRQLAERVADVVEDIARALESAPWADEGPYAADAAALVRSYAQRPAQSHVGALVPDTIDGARKSSSDDLRAASGPVSSNPTPHLTANLEES